jgi:ABC-2 type transport system ATP-binding protein
LLTIWDTAKKKICCSLSMLSIDLKNVTKIYRGRVHALRGIEMHVRRGEVFGLLGPNGAGKSTLVKIMMTVVRPTQAQGVILGQPIGHKPTLARVGYLPENHRFPRYLTGRQTLEFFGAMAQVDRPTTRRRAGELLDIVRMGEWAGQKVSTYSKGMMQRIGLAQALMNDPDLVLLDEPTDGVDPVGRREILDVLHRLREQGKTVFINSHALSELESICDRIAILVRGQVARQGTIDELTIARQHYDIELSSSDPAAARQAVLSAIPAQWSAAALPALPARAGAMGSAPAAARTVHRGKLPDGQWIELDGSLLRVGATDPAQVQPIVDALRACGLIIRRLQPMRATLEDLFLETVTDPSTGQAAGPGGQRGFDAVAGVRP